MMPDFSYISHWMFLLNLWILKGKLNKKYSAK